ncbi:hypothetical protein CFC21_066730 [Triticum aestivum]|uniref:Flavin-containing monooxygenase n=3 Tax=Triticum TaxID=4564 RepID=A0A9R0WR45_TRITD|nr:flavin-containing monooxygenase FMO GS-OX-like 8 [Triticum aestivum]KAF7059884.1 hypothetical protein CFC21_066730 [Triticum aestivum]VAI19762.1 unnamed protein product [Triticum turgidum subsp. durum]
MAAGDGEPEPAVQQRPQLQSKNVCVVGGGMAGLAAARELRREGHAVTVMEQSGDVGGQWLYDPAPTRGLVPSASSAYASLRLRTPREAMGFSDFQLLPRDGAGRDPRRFPGHREVHCYLRDFCAAFGLMDAVRLNTRVVRVAPTSTATRQWAVRSVRRLGGPEDGARAEEEEEEAVFDAVVVATGQYSHPVLPSGIEGAGEWRRRQLHSHLYRTPEPFRGEAVVVVGCGDSGTDIALDLRRVARVVHLAAGSEASTPAVSRMVANHGDVLRLHPRARRLHADGRVSFDDGSSVVADTVIYCTGYGYSFPFLDTGGAVAVGDGGCVVGPLFEHVFPPSLAPSLSFVGVPRKVLVPWFVEAQARWVAQALSGRRALPPEAEMVRAVEEHLRAREAAGVPRKHAHHHINGIDKMIEFMEEHGGLTPMEEWKEELLLSSVASMCDDLETFRDRADDGESVRKGLQGWRGGLAAQAQHEAMDAAAEAEADGLAMDD